MNITSDNILLAQFLGWTLSTREFDFNFYPAQKLTRNASQQWWIDKSGNWVAEREHLRFHESFDALMLVIDKIETLTSTSSGKTYEVMMDSVGCYIYDRAYISTGSNDYYHDLSVVMPSFGKNKLAATYVAVVNFVKWYNKSNPTTTEK